MKFATRLKQAASALSSTTLSVGVVVTLGSAATNFRTLAQAISDGAAASDTTAIQVGDTNVPFFFDDGTNWMEAYCTITSGTQITISQIISGSNGTSAVTFAGALPSVFNAPTGKWLRQVLTSADGVNASALTQTTTPPDTYIVPVIDPATNNGYYVTIANLKTLFASADTTAPVLSSATGLSTGTTTGSGSVTTDEGNGTLYYLASVNTTETSATIKAANLTQAVSSTGMKNVTFTGLTASTTYYAHYVQVDAAGNTSNVANSTSFTTSAAGDTTPPTLTSPAGTATGATTATATVSTNESNGTLYYMVSANTTETATTVKAASSQAVTAAGTQNVSFTGLTASTQYYTHFLHRDAAGNDSTVANGSGFTTSADTTAPTLSSPTGTQTGSTTASGTVVTNEANGTLYRYASTNATETAATVKAANLTQAVTTTGSQSVTFTGLTASTTYYAHYVHRDAAGNDSAVVDSASFTTAASATMASQYILSSTNSAYASYAGATMTGTSPNKLASTAIRVNVRSALTTSASYPATTDFKFAWGKAASDPTQSVCPIAFANTGVPANGPNGNDTAGGSNTVGVPTHLGGWSDSSSGFFGTFTTGSTIYAIGTPGNYVLWLVYSDGSSKMFDNNTGTPVIWVLS